MKKYLRIVDKLFPPKPVLAHCDIPCGIYDPHEAQMASHTVLRMTRLINELNIDSDELKERKIFVHQISRFQKVKEEHAELVKHQVRIIWGDYFKTENLNKFKSVSDLVFRIMKTASKTKQNIVTNSAEELVVLVQEFSEIFWKTKDRKTVKVASGYPGDGEIVIPR